MIFGIFGIISVGLFVAAAVIAVLCTLKKEKAKRFFTPLNWLMLGAFLALWCLFIPVWFAAYGSEEPSVYVRPVLMAFLDAVGAFFLSSNHAAVEAAVPTQDPQLYNAICIYSALMHVVAPVLTFSNVLSLFQNLMGELRLLLAVRRPLFIFSAMNRPAVAMAESIHRKPVKRALIIFTDVFVQDEEADYELLMRVRDLNAICLKKDIAHLRLKGKRSPVEVFLIGGNESENLEQAISLTQEYKNSKVKMSIHVFATSPSADYILDSLDKGGRLLNRDFQRYVAKNPGKFLTGDLSGAKGLGNPGENTLYPRLEGDFSLRRVDHIDLLVMGILGDRTVRETLMTHAGADKTICITILGMGSYGTHFLKTAAWLYQMYGYRLKFNVFDLAEGSGSAEKRLAQECPELVNPKRPIADDDAWHDIQFFTGIDCFGCEFDDLFSGDYGKRLKQTQLVFISLGDDDKDIEAAIMTRKRFCGFRNADKAPTAAEDLPLIYTVVYDDKKADNLNIRAQADEKAPALGLMDHKRTPYRIHFVGALSQQYTYEALLKDLQTEKDALLYHIEWIRVNSALRKYYAQGTDPAFCAAVDQRFQDGGTDWGDAYLFRTGNAPADYSRDPDPIGLLNEAQKYMQYSYFRRSSVAKAIYRQQTDPLFPCQGKDPLVCSCENCVRRRKSEHMRWNAYMRSQGYRYGTGKDSRSKQHPDLLPWSSLDYVEQFKD